MKLADVERQFLTFRKENGLATSLKLTHIDARLGKRIAICEIGERGTMTLLTEYMSYSEMNSYMLGYVAAKQNLFTK